jgi:hypothetical protein
MREQILRQKAYRSVMIYREQKKGRWKIAVALVALALFSCGVLIALDVRKVAVEKKVERKFAPTKTLARPELPFPSPRDSDN